MLKFDKSQSTNTVAIYPEVEVSSSVGFLRFSYSQDYDRSSGSFDGTITSKKQWVVSTVPGTSIPANTGLYTFDIYELLTGADLVWNTAATNWEDTSTLWNVGQGTIEGQYLTTERGFISGSNESSTATYYSANQNGAYITYNS